MKSLVEKIEKFLDKEKEDLHKGKNKAYYVGEAIKSAKSVLHFFEEKYPKDKRVRLTIETAENWLKNPTEDNRKKCTAVKAFAASASDKSAYHIGLPWLVISQLHTISGATYAADAAAFAANAANASDADAAADAAANGFAAATYAEKIEKGK